MEFPIVLVFLSRWASSASTSSSRRRRYVLLGSSSSRSSSRPGGDPISPIVLAGTMYVLYEFTIFLLSATASPTVPRPRPPGLGGAGMAEPAGRCRDAAERATGRRVRPARRDHHGPLGRGQDGHQQALRGPRLHGRGQRAQRAAARPRGARRERPGALPARRDRPRRAVRERAARARRRAGRAPRPRHRAPDLLPRGQRRGAHPALLGDAPPPPARHRAPTASHRPSPASAQHARRRPRAWRRRSIDTSDLSFRQLRERITRGARRRSPGPTSSSLQVISFGFKYGVPLEADLVFDVRFMENPFYRPELRPPSGLEEPVRDVRARPAGHRSASWSILHEFFAFAVPAYLAEGKTRLTIGHRLHRGVPSLGGHRARRSRATCGPWTSDR